MHALLLLGWLALFPGVSGVHAIPAGTALPVRLNSTLSSRKCKPGQQITARVMQDVPLPEGGRIRAGSRLVGHILRVGDSSPGAGGEIAFQFDSLQSSGSSIPLKVSLRALASFMETEDAHIPLQGADRGTMPAAYTTIQVGNDVVYRGGGPVMSGHLVVGRPVSYGDGVLARLRPNPEAGCSGPSEADDHPQAVWVFSSDACGVYGYPLLAISHAGRDAPLGEIVLTARSGGLKVHSGAGLLLRVVRQQE